MAILIYSIYSRDPTFLRFPAQNDLIGNELAKSKVHFNQILFLGAAQNALLDFFTSLVHAKISSLSFDSLLTLITQPIDTTPKDPSTRVLHKQGFQSIAKSVSALVLAVPGKTDPTVKRLVKIISSNSSSDNQRLYALLTIGEIGKIKFKSNTEMIFNCSLSKRPKFAN